MPSGAFALYIDQSAGGGPNAAINRVVPLPVTSGGNDDIPFRARALTLYYDDQPPATMSTITVTVRFLGTGGGTTIDLNAGDCRPVDVPPEACAASLQVDPPAAGAVRGALSALVEYAS